MTRDDFDNFLKNDVKITDWRGDRIESSHFFSFDEGWFELTAQLIKDCLAVGWSGKLHQSKEKFGGLRFYTGSVQKEIQSIVQKAGIDSYNTCEKCGSHEEIGKTSGWIKTFCRLCAEKEFAHKNFLATRFDDWWKSNENSQLSNE